VEETEGVGEGTSMMERDASRTELICIWRVGKLLSLLVVRDSRARWLLFGMFALHWASVAFDKGHLHSSCLGMKRGIFRIFGSMTATAIW